MQYVPPEQLVETITELHEQFKYFHLSVCVCGAPMWKHPCVICGHYPNYEEDRKFAIRTGCDPYLLQRNSCDRDRFISLVNDVGNFFEFYLRSFKDRKNLDKVRKLAVGLEWTNPGEIWDYYRREDIDHMGRKKQCIKS